MKRNSKQASNANTVKMLRYAAASLSAVSFVTTLNGINGIVTGDIWMATLISFGIQAIILVMGLWFLPALKTIWRQKVNIALRGIVIVFMIVLYICSVAFSSFFSYVYMSVVAYDEVQPTDYNTELELFLVTETQTLSNYNDAVYDVLLQKIRETAPTLQTIIVDYHRTESWQIQQIIGDVTKYETSAIPLESYFSAEDAISAFEAANRRAAEDSLVAFCQSLESTINSYVTSYETDYYQKYSQYFDDLMTQTDTVRLATRKGDIENVISGIGRVIENLGDNTYVIGSVKTYIESKCNEIISYYNSLIVALNDLGNRYDEILNHPDVVQGEDLTLQNFYEIIYSSDMSTQEKLDEAKSDLQHIVSAYIQNSDEIDEETISKISNCIQWLEKLNQCRNLRDKIGLFEINNLAKTYVITPDSLDGEGANAAPRDPMTPGIGQVDESTWNAARHNDMSEFISLVKSLPDIHQVLQQLAGENDPQIIYLREIEQKNYISNILERAYEYSRAKLENISDMERARNYLHSENRFLANCCLCIAIFLDVASCLIGLYVYTCQTTPKAAPPSEGGGNLGGQPEAQPSQEDGSEDEENTPVALQQKM